MFGCGSTTTISARPAESFFCARNAVYIPTYPPPTIRIRFGPPLICCLLAVPSHLTEQPEARSPRRTRRTQADPRGCRAHARPAHSLDWAATHDERANWTWLAQAAG